MVAGESFMDLRVIKTKKSLYDALLYLMGEHPFEEIKVSEICERAMANRSTFYAHFEDKYALLSSLIFDLKAGLIEALDQNEEITNSKEYYLKCLYLLFEHMESNREIYSALIVNNRNSIAMDMIYDTLLEDITKRMNEIGNEKKHKIPADFVTHFYLGAIFQIGMKWIQSKNYYSKEEILSYLEQLIPDDIS